MTPNPDAGPAGGLSPEGSAGAVSALNLAEVHPPRTGSDCC